MIKNLLPAFSLPGEGLKVSQKPAMQKIYEDNKLRISFKGRPEKSMVLLKKQKHSVSFSGLFTRRPNPAKRSTLILKLFTNTQQRQFGGCDHTNVGKFWFGDII
jgi:hypothetical protein